MSTVIFTFSQDVRNRPPLTVVCDVVPSVLIQCLKALLERARVNDLVGKSIVHRLDPLEDLDGIALHGPSFGIRQFRLVPCASLRLDAGLEDLHEHLSKTVLR